MKFDNKDIISLVLKNIASLMSIQILNYLLPLITIPYLIRVLGAEQFGRFSFINSIILLINIVTDFGFNLSATKEITINKSNKNKVNEIASAVMFIKAILLSFGILIFCLLFIFVQRLEDNLLIGILCFGVIIGNICLPMWFYQGIEKTYYVAIITMIVRLIITVSIFLFISNENDLPFYVLLNSLGYIIIGFVSLSLAIRKFKLKIYIPSKVITRNHFYNGLTVFVSNVFISLYTIVPTLFLGMLTNNTTVGYYSAVDKIIKGILGLITPFTQGIYPLVNKLINKSSYLGVIFLRKLLKKYFIAGLVVSLAIYLFSDFIVYLLIGKNSDEVSNILKIFSILPVIICCANVLAILTLLPFSYNKAYGLIYAIGGVISIVITYALGSVYQSIGVAVSVVFTELLITISMHMFLVKNRINLIYAVK